MTSQTDWTKIDALTDDEIDTSDIPLLDDSFFARATLITFDDLLSASQSSLDFWDNPYDDEDAMFLEKENMIRLAPMTQPEFDSYLESSIPEYAADKVRAGNWAEAESLERSRKGYADLLPQGLATPNNYLFSVKDSQSDERLGWFWLAVEKDNAFIYDIVINEEHRRKGYGTQVMHAAEIESKRLGCNKIGLHVFGFNKEAFALYQKLGFEVTNINMSKVIQSSTIL